jgi:hypothetical protein
VELWRQPLWRQAVAAAYHWYDMWIFKVPGFKLVENLLLSWQMRGDGLDIPLSAKQDIRCYHLTRKGRKDLATVEVDEETYRRLAGKLELPTPSP